MIPKNAKEVTREFVERVAAIMGPMSGAAQLLREADAYKGPVVYIIGDGHWLLLKPCHLCGATGGHDTGCESSERLDS
jgi:hypothetical protein